MESFKAILAQIIEKRKFLEYYVRYSSCICLQLCWNLFWNFLLFRHTILEFFSLI